MDRLGALTCPNCNTALVWRADVHAHSCKRCGYGVAQ